MSVSSPHETEDITQLVADCAASLSPTEPFLCNKDSFSLHDSMAALPLTDKKMDCCEIPASKYLATLAESDSNRTVFVRPPPTGLSDDFHQLPWNELTVSDAAYIAVQTLVRLQAFLSGCSVGESAATCLYAHKPVIVEMRHELFPDDVFNQLSLGEVKMEETLEHIPNYFPKLIVLVVALAILQVTEDSRAIVVNGDIYEEEDFTLNSYDHVFFTENNLETLLPLVSGAIRVAKMHQKEGEEYETIYLVLQVYSSFLSLAGSLEQKQTDLTGVRSLAQATAKHLHRLEARVGGEDNTLFNCLASKAFDAFVNRPLVGNAPVRKPKFETAVASCRELSRLVLEIDWVLCDIMAHGDTLARVQRQLDRVQQKNVTIYTRSLLVRNLFFEEKLLGQHELDELIIKYMRQWTHVPDEVFQHEDSKIFLGRLGKPLYDVLKLRILNRCRQRAYIEAVSIPDWLTLQSEAHIIDLYLRRARGVTDSNEAPYFSQFVLTVLLRLMDRYIASGLELGLFCGYQDIAFAFWYRDYILSALLNNLLSMRRIKTHYLLQQQNEQEKEQSRVLPRSKGHGKKKGNKGKGKTVAETSPPSLTFSSEDREADSEVIYLTLQRDLCRAMKRLIASLLQAGIVAPVQYEFTSPRRIFEERFEVFRSIQQPPPLEFDDFLAGFDFSQIPANDLWTTTSVCFQTCKRTVDQLLADLKSSSPCPPFQESELQWLQKVCVGNSIYLIKLQSIVKAKSQGSTKVSFDFDGTNQFCIVKLQN